MHREQALGIQSFDSLNFDQVLNLHGVSGERYNYQGYPELHNLFKINQVFSSSPWGEIVDRSGNTTYPFKIHIRLPWSGPKKLMSLEEVCYQSVIDIVSNYPAPYNIYWSGGIDSQLALVSFLKVVKHEDIVVYHNKSSVAESVNFFNNHISGKLKTVNSYGPLPQTGTVITGELGDTVWAILDDGFMNNPDVIKYLYKPWQEYFELKNKNIDFLEYASQFMKSSGRPIDTLFEARWWFYFLTKSQSKATQKPLKLAWHGSNFKIAHFYENDYFDTWSYHNTDRFIDGYDWKTYKRPAKEVIYQYDKDKNYLENKSKEYSNSVVVDRISNLNHFSFTHPLFITNNDERIVLPTEPFFSKNLYKELYYEKYKHLFNQ